MSSEAFLATGGVITLTSLYLGRKFFQGGVCRIKKDLSGTTIIVTGANTGIGKETVRELARMGATIILACRDHKKATAALEEIQKETQNKNLEVMIIDLADLKSIKKFVDEFKLKYKNLDVLINNASGFGLNEKEISKDGFEKVFAINYIGTFYLTTLLLDLIKQQPQSRIVNLCSHLHYAGRINWDNLTMEKKKYDSVTPYANSKFAILLFTRELQKRLEKDNVKVLAVHPGGVDSDLYRHVKEVWYKRIGLYLMKNPVTKYFWKNNNQGAQTSLYCAVEDFDKLQGGAYYFDCKPRKGSSRAENEEDWKRLWDLTEKIISEKVKQ